MSWAQRGIPKLLEIQGLRGPGPAVKKADIWAESAESGRIAG